MHARMVTVDASAHARAASTLSRMANARRDPQTPFGWYFRGLMDAAGYQSDKDLGDDSDLDPSLLSKWQSGQVNPNIPSLRKVAGPLETPLRELMVKAELVTAAEVGLSAEPEAPRAAMDPLVAEIRRLLDDEKIPEIHRDDLRTLVRGAVTYWFERMGVTKPRREPSASERASGRSAAKR